MSSAGEQVELVVASALSGARSRVAVADHEVLTGPGAHLVIASADRLAAWRVAVADHEIVSGRGLEVIVPASFRGARPRYGAVADRRVAAVLGADEVIRASAGIAARSSCRPR